MLWLNKDTKCRVVPTVFLFCKYLVIVEIIIIIGMWRHIIGYGKPQKIKKKPHSNEQKVQHQTKEHFSF